MNNDIDDKTNKGIAGLKGVIDNLKNKTIDEIVDRIISLMLNFSLPSRAQLFDKDDQAYLHVRGSQAFYDMLCSLYMSKEMKKTGDRMFWLTIVIAFFTAINVAAFIWSVAK
jgi:hypothetical protein